MLCTSKTWLQLFKISAHSGLKHGVITLISGGCDMILLRLSMCFDASHTWSRFWQTVFLKFVFWLDEVVDECKILAILDIFVMLNLEPPHFRLVKLLLGLTLDLNRTRSLNFAGSANLGTRSLRRHNVLESGESIEFLTKLALKLFNFECSQMLVWKYLSSGLVMATSFTSFAAFSCPRLCPTLCTGRTSFFRKLHSHS